MFGRLRRFPLLFSLAALLLACARPAHLPAARSQPRLTGLVAATDQPSKAQPKARGAGIADDATRDATVNGRAMLHAAIAERIRGAAGGSIPNQRGQDAVAPDARMLALLEPLQRDGARPDGPTARSAHFRVPPQAIRRIVRQQTGRFRQCYLEGMRRAARLEGRVMVEFEIGSDGRVWRARESAATLPDREVRRCLLRSMFELTFPNPHQQTIYVQYPLVFSRSGGTKLDTLADAARSAQAPPPGFAEAYLAGKPVAQPNAALRADPTAPERAASRCRAGDPLCTDDPPTQ